MIAVQLFGGVHGDSKGVNQLDIGLFLVQLAVLIPAVLQNLDHLAGIFQNLRQAGGVFGFKVGFGQGLLNVGQAEGDILVHRHVGPKGVVLEQEAHLPLVCGDVDAHLTVKHYLVADGDAAAGRGLQPGDHPQGGGLAAAGGAQQGDEGVVSDDQVQVVYGVKFVPTLGYVL